MQHAQANRRSTMTDIAKPKVWRDEDASSFSLSNNHVLQPMDHGGFEGFVAQSWLSDVSWDTMVTNGPWSNATTSTSLPQPVIGHEDILYSGFDVQYHETDHLHFSATGGQYPVIKTHITSTNGLVNQQLEQLNSHLDIGHGNAYLPEPTQYSQPPQYEPHGIDHQSCSPVTQLSPHQVEYSADQYLIRKQEPQTQPLEWPVPVPISEPAHESLVFINTFTDPNFTPVPAPPLQLNWSPTTTEEQPPSEDFSPSYPEPALKRKLDSPSPVSLREPVHSPSDISDFVVVFENAPGALASVKKRKKLDAPVRKAAKDVRRAGACHQCRFRKRTCSTGTPCGTCLKQGGGLHELRCQRESPFVGKLMHRYFEHSSTRRVIAFTVSLPQSSTTPEIITIDGVGRLSHPVRLRAQLATLASLPQSAQAIIKQTEDSKKGQKGDDSSTVQVMILEDSTSLGEEIEQWALEYTSKFVHAAGPNFYSTTMAQILGTAYVKKGLPESALVASMLRVAALAFILRAGVKYTPTPSSPATTLRYRTIQARIDSILYDRLKLAERDLFQRLQALIFRTAGCLNKDQVYPVALVMWQLMRILSIGASHLGNIVQRFKSKASGAASYQLHGLQLLISTHLALFRTSNPLLLNFKDDKFNQQMLRGDKELIKLAGLMRKVVVDFRKRGFPDLKGSIGYRKEFFEMFRGVYAGL